MHTCNFSEGLIQKPVQYVVASDGICSVCNKTCACPRTSCCHLLVSLHTFLMYIPEMCLHGCKRRAFYIKVFLEDPAEQY